MIKSIEFSEPAYRQGKKMKTANPMLPNTYETRLFFWESIDFGTRNTDYFFKRVK